MKKIIIYLFLLSTILANHGYRTQSNFFNELEESVRVELGREDIRDNLDREKTYKIAGLKDQRFIYSFNEKLQNIGLTGFVEGILEEVLNIKVEVVEYANFSSAYKALVDGQVDMMLNLTKLESREKVLDFSLPYYPEYAGVYTPIGVNVEEFEDLKGKKVWIETGSPWLESLLKKGDQFEFEVLIDDNNAFQRIDNDNFVFGIDQLKGDLLLSEVKGIRYSELVQAEPVTIAFNKGLDEDFKKVIDAYLRAGLDEEITRYSNYLRDEVNERLFFLNLTEEEKEYLKKVNDVNVLVTDMFFPFVFYDLVSSEYQGVLVDIFKEIEKTIGLSVNYRNHKGISRKERQTLIDNSIVEIVLGSNLDNSDLLSTKALGTEELLLVGLTTTPIYSSKVRDYLIKDIGYPHSEVELFFHTEEFEKYENIVTYDNIEPMLNDLRSARIDYILMPRGVFVYLREIAKQTYLKEIGVFDQEDVTISFAKENKILDSIIEKSLIFFVDTEVYQKQWANYTVDFAEEIRKLNKELIESNNNLKLGLAILIILVGVVAVSVYRMRRVNKEVTKAKEELYNEVYFDKNTGMYNKKKFRGDSQEKTKLYSRGDMVCLAIENVDYFYDLYDSDKVNQILANVARVIKRDLSINQYYKSNGGKFILIYTEESRASIFERVKKLREEVEDELLDKVNITFGIHELKEGENLMDVVKQTELAASLANIFAKDRILKASSRKLTQYQKNLRLEEELHRAIENREFIPHFQPKLDIGTQEVIGAEALIRWQHPSGKLIYPDEFIAIAEKNGSIVELDLIVAEKAMKTVKSWLNMGLVAKDFKISFNLSAKTFITPNIFKRISDIMKELIIPSQNIEIELTETILIEDYNLMVEIIEEFNNFGIKIALDDFSAGHSSTDYLSRLNIHTIKLDRALILGTEKDNEEGRRKRAVYEMMVKLADEFDLELIGEGLDTESHYQLLKELGVGIGQGYYFAKPLSKEEFIKYLIK